MNSIWKILFKKPQRKLPSMNNKLKITSLLLMLPLLTIALTTNYIHGVDALKSKGNDAPGRVGTSSYGSKTHICGDHPCSQVSHAQKSSSTTTKQKQTEAKTEESAGSLLRLSRASVPATIPLHKGWYDSGPVYYIVTDSSDQKHADTITKQQGWKVELAPPLAKTPTASLDPVYVFANGVKGNGIHGFQDEVFASTPAQEKYSAIRSHIHVTWKDPSKATVLDSEQKILDAQDAGDVDLQTLDGVIINMPQIVWPGGQMSIREDKNIGDDSPYVGGQVLNIDTKQMKVTFVAHRGWGPDGKTIYYIVTDATPSGPAAMMGVLSAPTLAPSLKSPAAVDLFQFMNGIKGSGPMGFQAGIGGAAPGDSNYSPLWRISVISWKDPSAARVLETTGDIAALQTAKQIDVQLARPMDSDHVVNCPFINPFQ